MSSPENQFKIRPAYQLMLIFILLGFGLGLYLNWKDTGSLIGHGFSVEYIESIEQDIKTEYEKTKGVKVIKVAMIREEPTKLTGFVKMRRNSGKEIQLTCSATLGETGNSLWGCTNK